LTPKRLTEAMTKFELNLKFEFDPFPQDCDDSFEIPLTGAPDIAAIGLKGGYITFSKYTHYDM
jgi:hypothetical protein